MDRGWYLIHDCSKNSPGNATSPVYLGFSSHGEAHYIPNNY